MLATFFFTMACTLALAAVMIAIRYRLEALADGPLPASVKRAQVVSAPREPEPIP
jgi:hypothetical protein